MSISENPLGPPFNETGQLKTGLYDTGPDGNMFHPANTNQSSSISENELAAFEPQPPMNGGKVENDLNYEPPLEGGVDHMAEAQSGHDAGVANQEGGESAEFEKGNEMTDGVPNHYIGGYIRGYEEAAGMTAPPTDTQPPLGPENVLGPIGRPNMEGGSPPGPDNGPGQMEGGSPPGPDNGPGQMEPGFEEFTNYAPANLQTGGDGFRLGVDAEMVGGQAVVEGYDNEQATCGGYGEELQVGGGSPFNFITDPDSGTTLSIFSGAGKALLKSYVKAYKHMQSGGAALLDGVDAKATGALYDGIQNAGAESLPGACDVTYDAAGPEWTHTQVGGGKKYKKRHSKRPCGCNKGCKSCKTYGCDKDPSKCKC